MSHGKLQKIAPVPAGEWPTAIAQFNEINRGRKIRVERYGTHKTHEHMEQASPLLSLEYDKAREDVLTIAVGIERTEEQYRVEAPQELWIEPGHVDKGEVMEIIDKEKIHTVISLE
jgi:hypothetical protein